MRASFLLGIFKIKTKRKDCPSVNNGIAGIPENRLGFVGEATYLPHLHIGAIRKGRPFFCNFYIPPGPSKQGLQRLLERCGDPDLSGAKGMHFKFIFHRGETHLSFLFTHTEDPVRVVVDPSRYIGARLGP